jgi:hypothetical protein
MALTQVSKDVLNNSQANITQVGTLANLTVTGNVSASYFVGNGSQLTGLPATYGNTQVASYLPTYTGVVSPRINPRVASSANPSSWTPDVSAYDQYCATALAQTLTINAPTGVPVDGQKLIFRIIDNGTTQTLSWNSTYTVLNSVLPASTTTNKTIYVGCIYNAAATRWDVLMSVTQQ